MRTHPITIPSFAQTNAHEWKIDSFSNNTHSFSTIKFITFAVINWNRKAPLCVRGENILELEANNFESSHNFSFQRKTWTIITRIHPTNPNIKHISNDDKDHEDPFQRSSRSPPVSHHSCKQLQCGIRRNRFCNYSWPQVCREFVLQRRFCSCISIRVSFCFRPSCWLFVIDCLWQQWVVESQTYRQLKKCYRCPNPRSTEIDRWKNIILAQCCGTQIKPCILTADAG